MHSCAALKLDRTLKGIAKNKNELLETDQERMESEFEMFLQNVEEDEKLQATLALYKNSRKDGAMSIADTDMAGSEGDKLRINMT